MDPLEIVKTLSIIVLIISVPIFFYFVSKLFKGKKAEQLFDEYHRDVMQDDYLKKNEEIQRSLNTMQKQLKKKQYQNVIDSVSNLREHMTKEKIEQKRIKEILEKIKQLKQENIETEEITRLLNEKKYEEAKKKIDVFESLIEKYNELKKRLGEINLKMSSLTDRVADGKLSSTAFEKAHEDLERNRKQIEEQIWSIRNELFKDEYEKPF